MARDPLLRRALEALTAAARERLLKHPQGHLLGGGRRRHLELRLSIPIGAGEPVPDEALDQAVVHADEHLVDEITSLLRSLVASRPGRLFCPRCHGGACHHSLPPSGREIFAGYSPNGLPRWRDFAQWLLEGQHPDLDRIYAKPPRLVAEVVSGRELQGELLDAYREQQVDHHIHGQVTVGWYLVPRADRTPGTLALCLQVVSTRQGRRGGQRRGERRWRQLSLNVLGAGPDGEPLAEVYDRLSGPPPWQPVVAWAQRTLKTIEASQGRRSGTAEAMSNRVEGLLVAMARRLEQDSRARGRRTGHAEARHRQGDRPTRMAHADLARGGEVYLDLRRGTWIVLGERGRAHVFSPAGKLVTSIRTTPEAIERKEHKEIWRPATAEEVAELSAKVSSR